MESAKLESEPEFEALVAETSPQQEPEKTGHGAHVETFTSIATNT